MKKRIATKFGVYLPAVIPFGGVEYQVVDAPLRGKRTFGKTDGIRLRITIDVAKHETLAELLQTLEHEIGHAIVYETGYSRPHRELNVEAHLHTQALVALVMAQ